MRSTSESSHSDDTETVSDTDWAQAEQMFRNSNFRCMPCDEPSETETKSEDFLRMQWKQNSVNRKRTLFLPGTNVYNPDYGGEAP